MRNSLHISPNDHWTSRIVLIACFSNFYHSINIAAIFYMVQGHSAERKVEMFCLLPYFATFSTSLFFKLTNANCICFLCTTCYFWNLVVKQMNWSKPLRIFVVRMLNSTVTFQEHNVLSSTRVAKLNTRFAELTLFTHWNTASSEQHLTPCIPTLLCFHEDL